MWKQIREMKRNQKKSKQERGGRIPSIHDSIHITSLGKTVPIPVNNPIKLHYYQKYKFHIPLVLEIIASDQ